MAADEFAISLDDEEVKHEDVQMADAAPLLNTAQGNGKVGCGWRYRPLCGYRAACTSLHTSGCIGVSK